MKARSRSTRSSCPRAVAVSVAHPLQEYHRQPPPLVATVARVSPKVMEPAMTYLPLTDRPVHTPYAEPAGPRKLLGIRGSRRKMCSR